CRQWPMRGAMPIRIRCNVELDDVRLQLARAHLLRWLQRCQFLVPKFRFAVGALAADLDPHRIRASNALSYALLTNPIRSFSRGAWLLSPLPRWSRKALYKANRRSGSACTTCFAPLAFA